MAIVFLLLFPVMMKIVEKMLTCYIVGMVESTLMAAHAVHTVKYYAMPSPIASAHNSTALIVQPPTIHRQGNRIKINILLIS